MVEITEKKKKSMVPSVEKAFDILELLSEEEFGMTMNEIVGRLDRTMGEIYRIVIYLTERGYLIQNAETSRYSLTLRLYELSHRHDPTERLIRKALPLLERVAEKTKQSCHIAVMNRANILVLASVQSPRPAGYSVRTGAIFPIETTSSGHVILAFAREAERERYLARLETSDRNPIERRIKKIRETGFEDAESMMIQGVRNLCVPVFDSLGVVAAITSGFIHQTPQTVSAKETIGIIRETALELSQGLGFRVQESEFESVLLP